MPMHEDDYQENWNPLDAFSDSDLLDAADVHMQATEGKKDNDSDHPDHHHGADVRPVPRG